MHRIVPNTEETWLRDPMEGYRMKKTAKMQCFCVGGRCEGTTIYTSSTALETYKVRFVLDGNIIAQCAMKSYRQDATTGEQCNRK